MKVLDLSRNVEGLAGWTPEQGRKGQVLTRTCWACRRLITSISRVEGKVAEGQSQNWVLG